MKISLHSDLHLEFSENRNWLPEIPNDVDVVVLAGDINVGERLVSSVEKLSQRLPEASILSVAGNHEFYGYSYQSMLALYQDRFLSLRNCHFLEMKSIELAGVRFLGCTLWTDFCALEPLVNASLARKQVQNAVADFRLIGFENSVMSADDMCALNRASIEWLHHSLEKEYSGKSVVITHFPPLKYFQHPHFPTNEISAYFLNDLEALLAEYQVDYWFFGHNHWNEDVELDGCRFLSSQRGYPGEIEASGKYRDHLIIDTTQ